MMVLVVCINWKSTASNEVRPKVSGRDNGTAARDVGWMYH